MANAASARLAAACASGSGDDMEHAIARGADLNAVLLSVDGNAPLPLVLAAVHGNTGAVRALIKAGAGVDGSSPYGSGVTALGIAANFGHRDIVRALLEAGADTSLTWSTVAGAQDVRAVHVATRNGHTDIMRMLIDVAESDVDAVCITPRAGHRTTALHIAVAGGHAGTIRVLLDAGARIDAADGAFRALKYAVKRGHGEVIPVLMGDGLNVNAFVGPEQTTLLHAAAKAGHSTIVRTLIRARADLNAQDTLGATPLIVAAAKGHADVLRIILANGARIDIPANGGRSALHAAAARGHGCAVEVLVEWGADAGALTTDGSTPRQRADDHNHSDVFDAAVARAHGPWTRERHHRLPHAVRQVVPTVLLCARRIAFPLAGASGDGDAVAADGACAAADVAVAVHELDRQLPPMPTEMWQFVLGTVHATDWLVCG